MKFILGKKIGMSQIFGEKGKVMPLTWIEAGPCFITQVKTKEKDEYEAIQIGFIKKNPKKVKKTEKGKEFKHLKETRDSKAESPAKGEDRQGRQKPKVGEKIDASIFSEGDIVKVSGTSKGKGFQGVVKRWGFAGAPKSHGTKHTSRMPGSIGQTGPQRVFKGKKMAGRTGGKRVTVKNLKIIKVDKDKNLIAIEGAIPGHKGTLLEVQSA